MTEKPEPLTKEKIKTILLQTDTNKYNREKVVKLKDLKSAVEWLLKEIKEIGEVLEKDVKYFDKLSYVAGLHDGLTNVIVIIKKTFEVDEE